MPDGRGGEPTFIFFSRRPENSNVIEGLASSLQKIETCFLLIALARFPTALSASVAAIESVLHSSRVPELQSSKSLESKFATAQKKYPSLQDVATADLDSLRVTRNAFEHRGFIPKDDSKAARLLIDVAFPYLERCYQEIHSFGLLSSLDGELTKHFVIAGNARKAAGKAFPDGNLAHCFDAFGHYLLYRFGFSLLSHFAELFEDSEEHSVIVYERHQLLERQLPGGWTFDCPICGWPDGTVCQLDKERLLRKEVRGLKMACANCEFVAHEQTSFLVNILLREQFADKKSEILADYGIET
jgi:hypothetical protein